MVTQRELYEPMIEDMGASQHYFYGKSLEDACAEMPASQMVDIGDRFVEAAVVEPDGARDEEHDLVLSLPYLNGWTPHHYIRGKALQHIVAPDSRVIVLPNSSFGKQAYTFTDTERQKITDGDISPLAEQQMAAVEKLAVGAVSLTGYSQGGRNVLGMTAVGSDKVEVVQANADEMPSKVGRGSKQLQKDFMKSSRIRDLRAAVRESRVDALTDAMNAPRMARDLTKFGLAGQRKWAKDMAQVMTGSAEDLVESAVGKLGAGALKLGFIEGSRMFDPASLSKKTMDQIRIVQYVGKNLHGHASGDDVYLHAGFVDDAFNCPRG